MDNMILKNKKLIRIKIMSYNNVESFLRCCAEPENYNFEFECDIKCYIKKPSLERYLIYRATHPGRKKSGYCDGKEFATKIQKSQDYKRLEDCDGSQGGHNTKLIHNVYYKLWGWKRSDGTFGSVEVDKFKCQFGADTMNSMQYILNDIVKEIILREENKPLRDKKNGKPSINYLLELYANEECREILFDALNPVIGLCEYADVYHTIGNFCLVPSGFNQYRGGINRFDDYWDLSLQHLKNKGWKDNFNGSGKDINDYYRYINYFFMWDYVDANGNAITLLKGEHNDIEHKEQFFKKAIQLIKRRGYFMVAMLRLQQLLGIESYAELRNSVFSKDDSVYNRYEDVFEAVKECLKDNMTEEIENLLLKTRKQMSGIYWYAGHYHSGCQTK